MKPRPRAVTLAVLLVATIGAVGAARAVSAQDTAKVGAAEARTPLRRAEYRIGPEDGLFISVWRNDVLSRTVTVRPDGRISLPLVNDVQASGLTPTELREALARRLSEYMPAPEVSVIVTDVRSYKVSVLGEVTRPGRYELRSWHTVLDVLALAGGFTPFAGRSRIRILRPDGDAVKQIPFNYTKLASEGRFDRTGNPGADEGDFYLRPGDIVLVP
jgi:polysaccharide export outer membrane protein